MPRVAVVAFRIAGQGRSFDAGQLELSSGDRVVVRTSRGVELGVVRRPPHDNPTDSGLKPILRLATEDDLRRDQENIAGERQAMKVGAEKIAAHGLPMKLIEAESNLDGSRIVLHFSAEGRVDFRALVRDLARALHTRVELHQVGVRDETKMRGGLGPCGRILCCASFLTDFDPVGIRMAKEQDLSLNPQKISGACGRLMCCLNYEYQHYREAKKCLPKVGSRIETDQGPGKIIEINVIKNRVTVFLDGGGKAELPTAAVARHKPGCPHLAAESEAARPAESEAARPAESEAAGPADPEADQVPSSPRDS